MILVLILIFIFSFYFVKERGEKKLRVDNGEEATSLS